jgi:hypothetical protein
MFGSSKLQGHLVVVHSVVDTGRWDSAAPQVIGCVLDDGQGLKWLEHEADVCVVCGPQYVKFTSCVSIHFHGVLRSNGIIHYDS